MATKKDLVEAHAFSRRRLVTAFLSGAPGGREVEPSRPGRMIIGGLALSVLLVAGAAIASVLAARTPADWQKPGIIVSQGGPPATYVILDPDDPVLHPILNSTSAQLIFGADQQPTTVSRDTLDKQTPSDTIGIYDAPPELPETSKMIYSGWTVCTGDGLGLRLDVDEQPAVRSGTGYGFTVTTGEGAYYLVTVGADDGGPPRARAFPVPDLASSDAMLDELGVASRSGALSVPADFVRLFEPGGTLDFSSFGFDPTSGRLPQGLRGVPGATVGAYVEDASGDGRVLTPDGILRLDPFALAVYRRSVLPGTSQFPPQLQLPEGTDLPVTFTDTTYADANWPTSVISRETPVRQVCAVLSAAEGERPGVRLGIEPGDEASAAAVDPDDISVRVQPGHGAFVYDGAFDQSTGGEPWVLNSQGIMYSISDAQSVAQLQYDALPAPVVPDPWVRLFESGVDLSTAAALCPPVPTGSVAPDQVCSGAGEAASPSAGTVAGSSG